MSDEKMKEIEAQIEADRRKLADEKDMAEGERKKLEEELLNRESDLQLAKYSFFSHSLQ